MNLHENASKGIKKKKKNIKPLEKKEQNGREVKRLQQNFSTWNAGD